MSRPILDTKIAKNSLASSQVLAARCFAPLPRSCCPIGMRYYVLRKIEIHLAYLLLDKILFSPLVVFTFILLQFKFFISSVINHENRCESKHVRVYTVRQLFLKQGHRTSFINPVSYIFQTENNLESTVNTGHFKTK